MKLATTANTIAEVHFYFQFFELTNMWKESFTFLNHHFHYFTTLMTFMFFQLGKAFCPK